MALMVSLFVISGLILCIISIPLILKKIIPNGLYGFRVRKTLGNPDIWYEVNCYTGKWLLGTGLIIVLAAIGLAYIPGISIDGYALGVLAVFIIAFAISLLASVRYLNTF